MRGRLKQLLFAYTFLYILLAVGIWGWFALAGKSLICTSDAYTQHINALMAYGKWMRGILWRLIHEHRLTLENYSFGIGYGADFYTSMQYYAVGDPLNLPAAFLPTTAVYYYYQFLIVLRPYLAGLSFLALVRGLYPQCALRQAQGPQYEVQGQQSEIQELQCKIQKSQCEVREPIWLQAQLAGALSYAFSGTVLFIGMWNPFFVNPMIYFPLIILGIERMLNRSLSLSKGSDCTTQDEKNLLSPALFLSIAVFLATVSNFYFLYMMVLLAGVYVIVRRFLSLSKVPAQWKHPYPVLRIASSFLLGMGMGAVIFFPVALAFFNNPRAGITGHALKLFYEADYYKELLRNLISYIYHPKYDTELGLTVMILPILVVFIKRLIQGRKNTRKGEIKEQKPNSESSRKDIKAVVYQQDKACFILLLCMAGMLLVPVAGYVLNGFSYMINRWCWALVLLLCFLITSCWEDMVAGIASVFRKSRKADVAGDNAGASGTAETIISGLLLCLTLGLILYNGYLANAPSKGNLPNGFLEATSGKDFVDRYEGTEVRAIRETTEEADDDFYRYSGRNLVWNAGLTQGISSTQFYFSLANGAVSDFMEEMAVNEMADYSFFGPDDRLALLSMAGVKYYSLRFDTAEEQRYVPASFVRDETYYNFAIYENAFPLSLGYLYHSSVPEKTYQTMHPAQRQTALLQGVRSKSAEEQLPELQIENAKGHPEVVLDNRILIPYEDMDVRMEGVVIPFQSRDSFELTENELAVEYAGATCTLSFSGQPHCETYLYWPELHTWGTSDMVNLTLTAYRNGETVTTKTLSYKSPESQFYSGWHNYLVNFGYAEEPIDSVVITFPERGSYQCGAEGDGGLQIIQQPIQPVLQSIVERHAEGMTDVSLHKNPVSYMTNRVTGQITAADPSYLLLNIPYAKGWTATIDGVKTDLERANTMFLGCMIAAGTHEVELRYRSPGLVAGLLVSVFAWSVFLWLAWKNRSSSRTVPLSPLVAVSILIICAVTAFPLLKSGMYGYAPDYLYHMNRIEGVKEALLAGKYPAVIYDHFFHGQGYASPLFYPDLFLLLPALFCIVGTETVTAYKLSVVIFCAAGSLTTYFSLRYILSGEERDRQENTILIALTGTFLLLLSQFYLADIIMRSGYSGYISCIFLPVWLSGLYDFAYLKGEKPWLLGIGFGGLLLSHTINTFIAVMITLLFGIGLLFSKRGRAVMTDKARWIRLLKTAGITLLITGYYLFPMLEQMLSGEDFVFRHPWARISEHTEPIGVFFRMTGYFFNEAYVGVGVPVLLAVVFALIIVIRNHAKAEFREDIGNQVKGSGIQHSAVVLLLAGMILLFAMTNLFPWSILEHTPLNNLQFTFRLYPFALLFLTAGSMMTLGEIVTKNTRMTQGLCTGLIFLSVALGIYQNRHIDFAPYQEVTADTIAEASDIVGKGEWLPASYDPERKTMTPMRTILYDAKGKETAIQVTIPKIYYKGYRAEVTWPDGTMQSSPCEEGPDGLCTVILPFNEEATEADVEVYYECTTVQRMSLAVSLLTLVAMLVPALKRDKSTKRQKDASVIR